MNKRLARKTAVFLSVILAFSTLAGAAALPGNGNSITDDQNALIREIKAEQTQLSEQIDALEALIEQKEADYDALILNGQSEDAADLLTEINQLKDDLADLLAEKSDLALQRRQLMRKSYTRQEQEQYKNYGQMIRSTHHNVYILDEGSIMVNQNLIKFDTPPYICGGRILVPVRAITQSMGADVKWNPDTYTVTITKDDIVVKITIGSITVLVNGEKVELDVPADISCSRTYVPLRFLAELFGYRVDWDDDDDTADLTDKPDTIVYETEEDTPVNFDTQDFDDVCQDFTGYALDYVRFSLPDTDEGLLYYNYLAPGVYGSVVNEATNYYKLQADYLDLISFLPEENYEGTLNIEYTAYNTEGSSYTGKVKIIVSDNTADEIVYNTDVNLPLRFTSVDFQNVCQDLTGHSLEYVKFTLPTYTDGVLFYNYFDASHYTSLVNAATGYYVGQEPLLSLVTFVPAQDFVGAVEISYIAYDSDGDSYPGTVMITVSDE